MTTTQSANPTHGTTPRRTPSKAQLDAEYDIPDDLVAAARRAAQAAAAKC